MFYTFLFALICGTQFKIDFALLIGIRVCAFSHHRNCFRFLVVLVLTLSVVKVLFSFVLDFFITKGLLRYGSVRNYGTVRLNFGKKYDTELRTEFLEKVRYGTEIRYYIFHTVLFPYSSNARFALLLPSIALFLLAYNFTPSVALAAHTTSRPSQYFK